MRVPRLKPALAFSAAVVLAGTTGFSQSDVADPAMRPLPNPTAKVIKNFGTLPDGRTWGSTAGVRIGRLVVMCPRSPTHLGHASPACSE